MQASTFLSCSSTAWSPQEFTLHTARNTAALPAVPVIDGTCRRSQVAICRIWREEVLRIPRSNTFIGLLACQYLHHS